MGLNMKDNDFGWALQRLKDGHQVRRAGWNGKGMFVQLVNAWIPTGYSAANLGQFATTPFIALKAADGKLVPWNASQADALANDWEHA
jgi:hypothetical protein